MVHLSDEDFDLLITKALDSLPGEHVRNIENVAIVMADEPTPGQREILQLRGDQTLLGLYEGVPLTERQGRTDLMPDKITLFKLPLSMHAATEYEVFEEIRHTIWHEIGHYYGLNHSRIRELEQ
jgi:predicted Zn-dependent protease with MMP-like domain